MKKTIIFGSLLAVILMLMIPNVSAVEYQTVYDENESYLLQKFQNRNLDIGSLKGKLKDMNIRELRETIQNINIDELKENILLDLENSDLTEQNKAYVYQLLDSELLLTILIRGIIIPVIAFTISVEFGIFPFWTGFFVGLLFLMPVAKMVEDETGIPSIITYDLLLIIDTVLGKIIIEIISPTK